MEKDINPAINKEQEKALFDYSIEVVSNRKRFDRGQFYELAMDMNESSITKVKDDVRAYALSMCNSITLFDKNRSEKETNRVMNQVEFMFAPWARLAGRIQQAIRNRNTILTESTFAEIFRSFSTLPEYAPYLESSFREFVYEMSAWFNIDYTKLPEDLKYEPLVDDFIKNYPYNVDEKKWDVTWMAYNHGKEKVMKLREAPSPINGYIGGEIKWSRFFNLIGCGPELKGGRINGMVTAVGLIDYKDCTNVFAIINGNKAAVDLFSLTPRERRAVLMRVFHDCEIMDTTESYSERRTRLSNKSRSAEEKALRNHKQSDSKKKSVIQKK